MIALPDEHIGHAVRRIKELRALERQSKDLRERCKIARSTERCGTLIGIADAAREPVTPINEPRHLRSVHER